MKRLLVTGSRYGWDSEQLQKALDRAWYLLTEDDDEVVLVHGAAEGVDAQAADYWENHKGRPAEAWPAEWRALGTSAGPIRNSKMVSLGADMCLAFGTGRGTTDCATKAINAGINTVWQKEQG